MENNIPNTEPTTGYGYDELKDFDMGYKDNRRSRITPFLGRFRWKKWMHIVGIAAKYLKVK